MAGVVFIAILVVIGIIVAAAVKARKKLMQTWGSVGNQLGLTLNPPTWRKPASLQGEVDGYPVVVDIHKRGSGNHKSAWTRFRLGVSQLPSGFELREEGFLSSVKKAFGSQDIEVGDAVFDDRLVVKGREAETVRAFLTADRRTKILRFFESHRGASIKDQEVTWAKRGRMTRTPEMLTAIEELLVVGRSLAGDDASGSLETTLAATSTAAAAAGMAAVLPAPVASISADAGDTVLPGPADVAVTAIPVEAVANATAQADVSAGAGAKAKGEAEAKGEAKAEAEAEAEAQPAPESLRVSADATVTEGALNTVTVAEFCETVFKPGALSFEASRVFDARFRGQRVAWSGTLEAAEPFRFDFVFGARNGVRGTLGLHRVEGHTIGDGKVKAVLQLPEGTSGLEASVGESLPFAGTLIKVDALSRKVFLADAVLTD